MTKEELIEMLMGRGRGEVDSIRSKIPIRDVALTLSCIINTEEAHQNFIKAEVATCMQALNRMIEDKPSEGKIITEAILRQVKLEAKAAEAKLKVVNDLMDKYILKETE